ncbi:MAG: DUF4065 domain-containing protein [Bacteroidetes bacterium]|nr:DUF4065 domain-containing protein [Bacteroidota bacterium]MCY4224750.1 DUF4065 domain-containing protein [Bacteroidota bacterium]
MTTPDALQVASQILWISDTHGRRFTPMQLLKIAYISHGWSLGILSEPMFDDPVEAWKYGPVVPNVYHKYKRFGYSQISVKLKDHREIFDQTLYSLLNRVVKIYGKFDGMYLSGLTHQPGTPWDITIKKHGEGSYIPNDLIKDYYSELSSRNES